MRTKARRKGLLIQPDDFHTAGVNPQRGEQGLPRDRIVEWLTGRIDA